MGRAIAFKSGAGLGGGAVSPSANVTISSFTAVQVHTADGGFGYQFSLSVTPPGGWTGKGCHLYLEYPDQSATTPMTAGSVLGSTAVQGNCTPHGDRERQASQAHSNRH